jgi:hypothetical protein
MDQVQQAINEQVSPSVQYQIDSVVGWPVEEALRPLADSTDTAVNIAMAAAAEITPIGEREG